MTPRSRLGRGLARVTAVAAMIWLGLMIADSADRLARLSGAFDALRFALSLLPGVIGQFATAGVFFLLVRGSGVVAPRFVAVTVPFFLSRMGRYLPGRLLGYLYQIHAMSAWMTAAETLSVTLHHFLLGLAMMAMLGGAALAGFRLSLGAGMVVAAVLTVGLYAVLRRAWFDRSLELLARLLRRPLGGRPPLHATPGRCGAILALLWLEWLAYLLVWWALLPAGTPPGEILLVSVLYLGAWFAGFVVLVVPGGLGVRESSFVGLGGLFGLDPAALLLLSLVFRLSYLIGEVAALGIALGLVVAGRGGGGAPRRQEG